MTVEDKIIHDKGLVLDALIRENRVAQEREKFETITELYESFMKNKTLIKDCVYLNRHLLMLVVGSYFDDIYKYQLYSHSEQADRHKQGAYMIKWISKIRPIQILNNIDATTELLSINGAFALLVGFSTLRYNVFEVIDSKFYDHLLYETQYREISGKNYATLLYTIEKMAEIAQLKKF